MTGRSELWYLDRLRAELQRAAEAEDRRERRGALGRLRLPPRADGHHAVAQGLMRP